MNSFRQKLAASAVAARVVPFGAFVLLTFFQGKFGSDSQYWMYAIKTAAGAALIWLVWDSVREVRWNMSWEALVVGLVTFVIWVRLDPFYPKFFKPHPWNPFEQFGTDSALAVFFVATRILGSTIVVPLIEEVFYRSFLYRYISNADFQSVPLNRVDWRALAATSLFFGFAHREWLAGVVCGLAYQWLVIRKNRLGDAVMAHAITNLLLGLWVVWKGAWQFW